MFYTLTLWRGCTVSVARLPGSNAARARVLESRGAYCIERRHQTGVRSRLWEMLPGGGARSHKPGISLVAVDTRPGCGR